MRPIGTALILATLASASLAQERTDPRKDEIVGRLNRMRITLDFKGAPIEDVLSFLREYTQINFHLDPELRTTVGEDQLRITIRVRDLLLKSALKLVLSSRDLTGVYKDGLILIQHKSKAAGATTLQVYDVRDLLLKIQDFPGPKVELASSSGGSIVSGATFVIEEPVTKITEDFITDMVKGNTGDRSWDENPRCSISLANGLLVVTQTRKVHDEIKRLLGLLRQFK